jgi:hypothetical protein
LVVLRLRNDAATYPINGKPWSSRFVGRRSAIRSRRCSDWPNTNPRRSTVALWTENFPASETSFVETLERDGPPRGPHGVTQDCCAYHTLIDTML